MEYDSVMRKVAGAAPPIKSFARELRVLEELARMPGPAGVTELAGAVGLAASTTHRILGGLVREGYARRDGDRKYELGSKILVLAREFLNRSGLRRLAQPRLQALKERTGETAYLVVKDGDQGVCIDCVESRDHMRVSLTIGGRCDLYCSAVGKVFLADYAPAETAAYLRGRRVQKFTPRTLTTLPQLLREAGRVRARGFGADDEEHLVGVRCVAAPVRDFRGVLVACLAAGGPSSRIPRNRLPSLAREVMAESRLLSEELGSSEDAWKGSSTSR